MSLSITLTFRWPMGHRILGLTGGGEKCRNIHGHNWTADVEFANDDRRLEFGEVKGAIQEFIDQRLDHGFLVAEDDPFVEYLDAESLKHFVVKGRPDTEMVASLLADVSEELIGRRPLRVHVLEGYRNAATWTEGP